MDIVSESEANWQQESPKIISMTMTSRCNLRCVMCDHGIRNVKKEDFQADLVDMTGDFISSAALVDLTGLGEPMLSDLFWKILDKFPVSSNPPDSEFFLTFNSNGTLLSESNIERILRSRVRKIRISIDSTDSDLFHLIRGTALKPIVDGLRRLIRRRNELGRHYPKIHVEMTLMRANIGGLCDMADLCADAGADLLEIWSLNHVAEDSLRDWKVSKGNWTFDYAEQMVDSLPKPVLDEAIDNFYRHAGTRGIAVFSRILGDNRTSEGSNQDEFMRLFTGPSNWKPDSIRCGLPWTELRVSYDGDVFACCWGPKPIGNLRNETLESIWNGISMRQMRADLVIGNIPDLCAGAACDHVANRAKRDLGWQVDAELGASLELAAVPVRYEAGSGLYGLEVYDGRPLRWTNGAAEFHVTVPVASPQALLDVKLWPIGIPAITIFVNDQEVLQAEMPPDGLDSKVDLGAVDAGATLVIRVSCIPFTPEGDSRQLGVAIEGLRLVCRPARQTLLAP